MKKHVPFRIGPRGLGASMLAVLLMAGHLAAAQDMPPPHKMPRVPVKRQALEAEKVPAIVKTRETSGQAAIIDAEHLRIGDVDLRLFGVVPPQLSASYGPQARTALDELTRGKTVTCHVRDRDHDGRFLATCSVGSSDLALELLKRGLAVAARGSLHPSELEEPYEKAEDAAQQQKLGLWATAVPPQAAVAETPPPVKTENPNLPPLPSELKKDDKPAAAAAVPAVVPIETSLPKEASAAPLPVPAPLAAAAPAVAPVLAADGEGADVAGFFARYQLLITGLVMLVTALSIMIVLAAERRRDKREEMRAIAAALRGELLAARAVCQARLRTWADADEKTAPWPRIRATLYQAYVGKVGWLGAVLARQVASIYGQSSDYAAYFNPNNPNIDPRSEQTSKRRALQTLVQHIEEVLPKLASIEQTGLRPGNAPQQNLLPRPAQQAAITYVEPAPSHDTAPGGVDHPPPYDAPPHAESGGAASRMWTMMQKFRSRRPVPFEDPLPDYTALLEEEMARMSSEEESAPHSNVTRIRGGGS